MSIPTIMNKTVDYVPTSEEIKNATNSVRNFFDENYPLHIKKGTGITNMFGQSGKFWEAKGWFISAMKKHPDYNGNFQIVIPVNMTKGIDRNRIDNFEDYLEEISTDENDEYRTLIISILRKVANSEGIVKYIDSDIPQTDLAKKFCHSGRRITKVIGDIAREAGFVHHTDIHDVMKDGRKVTKDFGWNWQFAALCDAISPISITENIVISVHPRDFYGIADGDNWSSCYYSTKLKPSNSRYAYNGCHCNATQSHMLDDSSIVVYTQIKGDKDHPELLPKHRCCLFYLGEDKILQGRVYPDCRDSNFNAVKKLREIVQKVIADIFDIPNYWINIKGTQICTKMVGKCSELVYPDHLYFNDCNVSFAKRIDGYRNENEINIGAEAICPECGETNKRDESLFCEDCKYEWATSYLMSLGWNKEGAEAIIDTILEYGDYDLERMTLEELERVSEDYKDR